MGGLKSLNKGKRAEREVVKLFQPIIDEVYSQIGQEPPMLQRNLMQSHKGGYDIVGLDWMALEVKHHETLNVKQWWKQATSQAQAGQEPVLIYRKSRMKWRVMMFGYIQAGEKRVRTPVDITIDAYLVYLRVRVEQELLAELNP